jgi:4-hydroxy-3-polyprenylbenzoate decarboxylase
MRMSDHDEPFDLPGLSRRELLAAGAGLSALTAGGCVAADGSIGVPLARAPAAGTARGPFDSFRDYVAALEAHGLVLRLDRVDQDAFHATALVYRANDRFGMFDGPAYLFENVKIDGQWVRGPVIGCHEGNWHTDAIVWGLPIVPGDGRASYRRAKAHLADMLRSNGGTYPSLPPLTVERERSPCKQVVLRGEDIDLTRFPFLQTNPADAGRYVNTGSVFMHDPEMGGNFGTYRCQLKGPRRLGLNPEPGQTGWKMLMAAKKRGEATAHVTIVLGQDPVVWMVSSTRVVPRRNDPVDELAVAGGMRGRAIEVVKCETNDLLVPAHAEMVIEGEVPLQGPGLPEGPFGEMFGYLGPYKAENFYLDVTAVTHRRDPWFMNAFTGMQRGMVTAPMDALYEYFLRRSLPNLVEIFQPQDAMGVAILSIDKTAAGQGLEAGKLVAERNPIAKVIIVVDKDIDVLDRSQVVFALGSRWQPNPASQVIKDIGGIITDPSQPVQGRTSKIIIDATRQLPAEGGRDKFPELNRVLLERGAPQSFADVDRLYGPALRAWKGA